MGMERKLERNQLKKNFLKEIIMRLDFQGVLQAEMEKILIKVKPYLKDKAFNRYNEKINNQAILEGTSIKEATSQIVYSFMDENSGYTLDLSTTSIILSVKSVGYSPFENYADIFSYVAAVYKEEIDFFTVTRFGFRKINFCFIKELSQIETYFESKYYGVEEPISEFDIGSVNRTSRLSDGKKNINLRYIVEQGEIDQDTFFKITLDSDIYSTDEETINQILNDKSELSAINDMLFTIYCGAITEQLADTLLSEEDNLPEYLVGVENNE
jgi:uncharacterized protein (TIGR04255 family)